MTVFVSVFVCEVGGLMAFMLGASVMTVFVSVFVGEVGGLI